MFVLFGKPFVIRVRPAPSFDQFGFLASTACTFLRRLMLIVFGCFLKNCALLQREAARVVSLRPPASLGRPGPQRQPRGTPRKRFGSFGVVSWKSPGLLWGTFPCFPGLGQTCQDPQMIEISNCLLSEMSQCIQTKTMVTSMALNPINS